MSEMTTEDWHSKTNGCAGSMLGWSLVRHRERGAGLRTCVYCVGSGTLAFGRGSTRQTHLWLSGATVSASPQ